MERRKFLRFRDFSLLAVAGSAFAAAALMPESAPLNAAVLDEAAATVEASAVDLRVPIDLTEEALEAVDADFAAKAGGDLRSVFDSSVAVAERLAAVERVRTAAGALDAGQPAVASLQRRLDRRLDLMQAVLTAMQSTVPPAPEAAAVEESAHAVTAWLSDFSNGDQWVSYLRLNELLAEPSSRDARTETLSRLLLHDDLSATQRDFLSNSAVRRLRDELSRDFRRRHVFTSTASFEAELGGVLDTLVASLLSYEASGVTADAAAARDSYRTLKQDYPEAAAVVVPALMEHYFNHNAHVHISEHLLTRIVADHRTDNGTVADCILGAWVTGVQTTDLNVSADIRPSSTTARFDLVANGNTHSNTQGRKDPATIYTRGNHFFRMSKPVYFDGMTISTGPTDISVNPNNTTVGASTDFDGIPILGGIARNIAVKEARKKKGQSEAIAARKLANKALPPFEEEVNNRFAEANADLQESLIAGLEKKDIAPDSLSCRSTDYMIAYSSRTMGSGRLAGSVQPPPAVPQTGLSAQLHESMLNNFIDALDLAGKTIPEADLLTEVEKSLTDLFGRDISLGDSEEATAAEEDEDGPATFVFSETDPIRVQFDDGQLQLILRTGLIREGKDPIPEQIITVPITVVLEDGKLVLEAGRVGVASVEEVSRLKQLPRATQIRRLLQTRLPRRELDPTVDLPIEEGRTIPMTLTHIQLTDGWLDVLFD